MACTSPVPALDLGIDPSTGKRRIKIKYPHVDESLADFRRRFGDENVLLLPCGHCLACRMARRKEWAVRCTLESLYHKANCFVTLTYDPQHYVDDINLLKRHFKEFIKALRNDGHKVRYFGCCERGEQSYRLHLHIALFGFDFDDKKLYKRSGSDNPVYISEYLNDLWKYGFAVCGDFASGVGNYIAGYVSKKVGEKDSFILMSKRPGIGYQYLEDHKIELSQALRIIDDLGDIKVADVPRYFEKICEKSGVDLADIKAKTQIIGKHNRDNNLQTHQFSHEEYIFKHNDFLYRNKLKKLKVRGN